jgi:hypothetical protein
MIAGYARRMSPRGFRARPLWPATLPLVLASCALGAYLSPQTTLERRMNGVYEGVGVGGTGRVPYRLTLSVQQREGRATAVLVNDESRKAYAGSGTFRPTGDGGTLELKFFENGDQHRANLHATVAGARLSGTLRTVLLERELLGYTVELHKVEGAATTTAAPPLPEPPAPAPTTP